MKLNRFYVISIILILSVIEGSYAQCAMCRAVLESNADNSVAEGINDGIIFLMILPYLLVGGVGYFIYRYFRTQKSKAI